jgi:hypothetical protein
MIMNRLHRSWACGLHGANGLHGLRRAYHLSFIVYYLSFIISLTCLSACCSHSDDTPEPTPTPGPVVETGTPISFSGQETEAQDVSNGVKGTRAETRAGTPLSELATSFKVWGYKNMNEGYGDKQEVFPGYTVNWLANSAATTTTNTNGWEYVAQQTGSEPEQTIKYWDWSAKAYRFFGATNWGGTPPTPPAVYEANKAYGADGTPGATYEISMLANCSGVDDDAIAANMAATPYFSRLWFSTGVLPDYPDKQFGKPVRLEFLKPYARVRFMFTYSYQSEGIKIKKKEFKPTDNSEIYRKGTFTVSYPLTGTATRESFTVVPEAVPTTYTAVTNGTTLTSGKTYYTHDTDYHAFVSDGSEVANGTNYFALTSQKLEAFTQEYIPDGGPEREKWYFVAPNNTQGSYTLSVWLNNDPLDAAAKKTAVVPAEYMTWLPGYSYTYIFKILEEGGVEIELVQSAVTPWTDMNTTHTVYNW